MDRTSQILGLGLVICGLSSLAVVGGLIWVIIHFILKVWQVDPKPAVRPYSRQGCWHQNLKRELEKSEKGEAGL